MKYIIIDLTTYKALYGLKGITLNFSTEESAQELAIQMCSRNYLVVTINLESNG